MPRDLLSWLRAMLLLVGIGLGIFLRVQGVSDMPFFGDEYHTRYAVEESYGTLLTTFDDVGSHVVLPLLQRLSMDLFGDGVLAMRLPALIPAILTLLLLFPLARPLVGANPACLATLALCFNPMHVYYSRFGRGYALMVLLGLLLGVAVVRALGEERRRWWIVAGACAVLLPYTQLSSAGFVATLGLAALALSLGGQGRAWLRPVVAFGVAAIVVVLLFLPLLSQVRGFFDAMPEERSRPLGWFGIPTLLAGGRLAAVVWLVAFPLSLWGLWRAPEESQRRTAVVCLAALVGPLAVLLVTRPHGMDYAYARYLLNALPFVLMGLAWLLCRGTQQFLSNEAMAGLVALGLGVGLIAASALGGPLSPGRPSGGSFDNSYLAMWPLAVFDEPHPGPPAIYATVAADEGAERVVELQPLMSRAMLLYRNYGQAHGKQIVVGWPEELPRALRNGPYADFLNTDEIDADYLILHKDLRREVNDYWRFVYLEALADHEAGGDESFLERHKATFIRSQEIADPAKASLLATYVRRKFGAPTYEDDQTWAWKLR